MTLVISKGLTLDNGTRAAAIAGVSPTLDYRFAREKREIETVSLTDKLTYTGGNGTFVGSDGFVQRATTNVPRFDHDPLSRQSLGLLSEVERTNSIRNNTMVGAVAGTPGTVPTNWAVNASANGITREIIGTGIEDGINYLDLRYFGTNTAGSNYFNSVTFQEPGALAAQSQTWTQSCYLRLISGAVSGPGFASSLALVLFGAPSFNDNSSASIASVTGAKLSSQRFTTTRTFANATTTAASPRIVFTVAIDGTIDFTLRIGLPQLEQGATASTPIPTTTAAVTRTADSAVIDGTGVLTGTYTLVEKPAGCAVVSGSNIELQPGFTAERVMVFPAALDAGQITAIRGAM
jgi:hypothetical protein